MWLAIKLPKEGICYISENRILLDSKESKVKFENDLAAQLNIAYAVCLSGAATDREAFVRDEDSHSGNLYATAPFHSSAGNANCFLSRFID